MAKITLTRKIVNAVRKSFNDGHVFNDKLSDGTRSVKVWGWSESDYDEAEWRLKALGCTVKRIKTRDTKPGSYVNGIRPGKIRLHVIEPEI